MLFDLYDASRSSGGFALSFGCDSLIINFLNQISIEFSLIPLLVFVVSQNVHGCFHSNEILLEYFSVLSWSKISNSACQQFILKVRHRTKRSASWIGITHFLKCSKCGIALNCVKSSI